MKIPQQGRCVHLRWMLGLVLVLAFSGPFDARGAERWRAMISPSGKVMLSLGRTRAATVTPGVFETTWRPGTFSAGEPGPEGTNVQQGKVRVPSGAIVDCTLRSAPIAGGVRLAYRLTPRSEITVNSAHISIDFPIGLVAGSRFVVDPIVGMIPILHGGTRLSSALARSARIPVRGGSALCLDFDSPTPLLLQDNRQWGPSFTARIGPQFGEGHAWPAGEALDIVFNLTAKEGIEVEYDKPVTIEAGADWIPLATELDIAAGSALDFSQMGQLDPPAGKHGWLIARPDGRFAFEKDPETPRRFYGVNLCFSAHYISHDEADRLAERLMRLGYNTVRFHHYERELVDRSKGTSTVPSSEKLDQLDYLVAALKKRGIYMTTDIFVSRPVLASEIWDGATGDVGMNDFKMLVPVNDRAFENWKAFARNLLTHVNPYTGLTYAQDPAMAWLCMINEGNAGNFIRGLDERVERDWARAWNAFLARRHGSREALEKAWGVSPDGDPLAGTVPLFKNARENSSRGRDLVVFLAEVERDMFARMKSFLRDEVGTRALLTDMNGWTNPIQSQAARAEFDYVDDHFYVDHPRFLEGSWRLPSRCDNTSPVADGAPGGRHCAFVRLLDKPFTISEYNYSGPGRFRGVGGILTGCLAALQRWDTVWRFTYSHNRRNLFQPSPAGYFDLSTDPLNQAAERAALCLYLRGDMKPAPHVVGIAMTSEDLLGSPERNVIVAPPWHALALVTRVGTFFADQPGGVTPDIVLPFGPKASAADYGGAEVLRVDPYAKETGPAVLDALRKRGWLADDRTDLAANRIWSETGELLVDGPRDVMILNTPRTAGCYAPEGETVTAGAVTVTIEETDATVWVSSLDGEPIAESRRLLITHLTDLQNTGARFGENARETLLAWGSMPHLVRAGVAKVTLQVRNVHGAKAWALSTSGRRVAPVPTSVENGKLTLMLRVRGTEGARMIYEVEVK